MINVKATKTAKTENPAERYRVENGHDRSQLPYLMAMFFLGMAAYLKSFLPGAANPVPEDGDRPAEPDTPETEKPSNLALFGKTPAPMSGETSEPEIVPDGRVGSGDNLFASASSLHSLPIAEEPRYTVFEHEEAHFDWARGFPLFPSEPFAANDNGRSDRSPVTATPPASAPQYPPVSTEPEGEEPENPDGDDDESETGDNRAPRVTGPVYLADIGSCATLAIGFMDLLSNAVDPDGDRLSVENVRVSSGHLAETNWGWTFTPDAAFGPVTITYAVSDGEFSVAQTARFSVMRNAVSGTEGDDLLLGGMCADDVDGRGGNDNIDARGGNDVVSGGAGDDHIVAGAGNDVLFGEAGNDILFGGEGDDRIDGGTGNDRLFGEEGDDILRGGNGSDALHGGTGEDVLSGESGDDHLVGAEGDDVLDGGAGKDVAAGGGGNDIVLAASDGTSDIFVGGDGVDTLDFSGATESVTLDMVAGTAEGAESGTDSFREFEVFTGGGGDDMFLVSHQAVAMSGGAGNDVFAFCAPPPFTPATRHEILDFEVGDRVRMSKYDLFERTFDEFEDRFEELYGDGIDDDDVAVRYRHDDDHDGRRTFIEADFNRDDIYETVIELQGYRIIVAVEHGSGEGEWA